MTTEREIAKDHLNTTNFQVQAHQLGNIVLKVGFFIWHYFEMMAAMLVGDYLFDLLVRGIPAIGIRPGTFLYYSGGALAMMVVMIAWMIVRGHGRVHSVEMAVAMLAPVAFVAVVSLGKGAAGPAWFADAYCSAMCVGMLAAMAFRWDHFTRWSVRSHHHAH